MRRLLFVVLLLLVCTQISLCSNPQEPVSNVSGTWEFSGIVEYGESLLCIDSMTMRITQRKSTIDGETSNWRFYCDTNFSTGPKLVMTGIVEQDSIKMLWKTAPDDSLCSSCVAFYMVGSFKETILIGWYKDFLGGSGVWGARKQ